jgi:predicted Zn-dependent protease
MKLLKKLRRVLTAKPAAKKVAKKAAKPAVKKRAAPAKKTAAKPVHKKKIVKPIPKKAKIIKTAVKHKKAKPAAAKLKSPVKQVKKVGKPAKPIPAPKKSKKEQRVQEFAQALLQASEQKKTVRQYPMLPGGNNPRVSMLLPLLRELVRHDVLSDWTINVHHMRSANVYVERNFTIEDELTALREDVILTIYKRFPDGTMGEAQLPIITQDHAEARQQILDAKEICQHARKKAFDLAQPSDDVSFPRSYDERILQAMFNGSGLQVPLDIYNHIKTVLTPVQDVRPSSFEVLTAASTVRVINSNGIDVSYHKTMLYLEMVLTCKLDGIEREFIASKAAVSPEQLDVQEMLLQQVQIARDATLAKPHPGFSGDVLLAGQSVTEVFSPHRDVNPIVLHTFARIEMMGLSALKLHQPIGHFVGEPITITSNPSLALGLGSAPVDGEGTPLKPVELIRNGMFVQHMASERYAQYLGVPATGELANIQISPGATREQHLRGNNYFEIVSFSWFHPNAFSGEFSAEIRLGYHWVNGRKTPFKGGTFTGNLFKNILNARFSKETTQSGEYYGPRAILFKQGTISKME